MSNIMKIGMCIFGGIFLLTMFGTCKKSKPREVSTDVIAKEYAKGLNLKLVAELARNAKDAKGFERQLNSENSNVNNIDLNDDGKVDYIKVTEYGSGNDRGFSLTTELEKGQEQEIATIQFVKQGNSVDMQVSGNSSLYGSGHHYHSSFGLTDALLLTWMFSDFGRPNYISPYGYGSYPGHYNQNWKRKTNEQYGAYVGRGASRSSFKQSSTSKVAAQSKSPNVSKTAARASILANPAKSQRSFQTRSGQSSSRSGGFGRSSSGSGSSSRSGSSFGGGK